MSNYLELIALVWFLICWLGYSEYSRRKANDRPCLSNTLDLYREDWMRVMLRRDNGYPTRPWSVILSATAPFSHPAAC